MASITFLEGPLGPAVRAEGSGRLLDLCDEAGAPVGFSCRSARCCTCRVEVLAGPELLEPPGEEEREVLHLHASTPRQRLACQAVVRPTAGTLRLRWVGARPGGE